MDRLGLRLAPAPQVAGRLVAVADGDRSDRGEFRWNTKRGFKVAAGGRTREYRKRVDEPQPGRVLTEADTGSSLVTTTTVFPQDGVSLVRISTAWMARAVSAACSSACSRRGGCAPSMRMKLERQWLVSRAVRTVPGRTSRAGSAR